MSESMDPIFKVKDLGKQKVKEGFGLPLCSVETSSEADDIYREMLKTGINNNDLEIKESNIKGAGLGVFARKNFNTGEVIERCHVIVLDWRMSYPFPQSIHKYAFSYQCGCQECVKYGKKIGISLGYGSIYNTSLKVEDANTTWYFNIHTPVHIFICTKPIKIGEEILVHYGEGYVSEWIKKGLEKNQPQEG